MWCMYERKPEYPNETQQSDLGGHMTTADHRRNTKVKRMCLPRTQLSRKELTFLNRKYDVCSCFNQSEDTNKVLSVKTRVYVGV